MSHCMCVPKFPASAVVQKAASTAHLFDGLRGLQTREVGRSQRVPTSAGAGRVRKIVSGLVSRNAVTVSWLCGMRGFPEGAEAPEYFKTKKADLLPDPPEGKIGWAD